MGVDTPGHGILPNEGPVPSPRGKGAFERNSLQNQWSGETIGFAQNIIFPRG